MKLEGTQRVHTSAKNEIQFCNGNKLRFTYDYVSFSSVRRSVMLRYRTLFFDFVNAENIVLKYTLVINAVAVSF